MGVLYGDFYSVAGRAGEDPPFDGPGSDNGQETAPCQRLRPTAASEKPHIRHHGDHFVLSSYGAGESGRVSVSAVRISRSFDWILRTLAGPILSSCFSIAPRFSNAGLLNR